MPRELAERGPGVVYTNPWVVDLMLDMVDYTEANDLGADTIVEPGCGDGAFLRRIVPRLIRSARAHSRLVRSLVNAVLAYELDSAAAEKAREAIREVLADLDVDPEVANVLATTWVIEGDFLLIRKPSTARWVVGNPPYVRVEESSPDTYVQYRERWETMSGRADIYIGFFEAGLAFLDEGGKLCFICADRWMHNQYGAGLRRHVINNFALRALVEVHDADVFDVPVAAYPAITLIERATHSATALATANKGFDASGAARLSAWIDFGPHSPLVDDQFSARVLDGRFNADASWPSGPPERLHMIALLEASLPSLTEVGVSVGVGMATGADKIYVVRDPGDIERQFVRKAIGPADLRDGSVEWTGRYLVSPWISDELADLHQFPGLGNYFQEHRAVLERRYVGKRNPNVWWRTIDRPPADEYRGSKLVVADINDRVEPVLDSEGHWLLHSAYFIKSTEWDLEALGGYLLSDVAGAFVEAYSVKMANGHLRVSGQYLKKIRIPFYEGVPKAVKEDLTNAFRARDRARASTIVRQLLAGRL